ncbi:MAG: hypothetical protein VX529_06665 [Pseudomonadota bacterium]|nr:hypothetical protein [Pseudomonadota bacterium]
MCDFKPGDEVTPVDREWSDAELAHFNLERGRVYTVASLFWLERYQVTVLCLSETDPGLDAGYNSRFFRKVQKRSTETGMEILRKALDDASVVIAAREGAS